MAGRGPSPKDPSKRARRNGDPVALRVIQASPEAQPELPDFDVPVEVDGEIVSQSFRWPEITRRWWNMWAESPLAAEFTSNDWSELMDTARIHAAYWMGDLKVAGELRLRTAKFGSTPEDRARLRIQLVAAEEAEAGRKHGPKVPNPYADLRASG